MTTAGGIDSLPLFSVSSAGDVPPVCHRWPDLWLRFTFTTGNGKAQLYGRSRWLKERGVDAMVREHDGGFVLIARAYGGR